MPRQVIYRYGKREKFPKRIPAQVTLLNELLHVFWRRPASARLVQTAARQ